MAWNPSPHIAECRDIAKARDVAQVILITIDHEGKSELNTYGETQGLCTCARVLGDVANAAICKHIQALVADHERHHQQTSPDLFTAPNTAHIDKR